MRFVYFEFNYSQLSGVENLPFFFKFGLDLAESLWWLDAEKKPVVISVQ